MYNRSQTNQRQHQEDTYNSDSHIQLLSKIFIDSDFCHNYLHTLCTYDLILQCIKMCKLLFALCFIKAHV